MRGVPQGRICSDNFTCCHTEIETADQNFHLTQSWYTDIGPTSPSTDPVTPGAWQGSHWRANFEVTGVTRPRELQRKRDSNPGSSALEAVIRYSGTTCGVMVSTSTFLACHQCENAGWALNVRALVRGIFLKLVIRAFSGYSGFLPSFIGEKFQSMNKMNAI